MLESAFQARLIKKIKKLLPGAMVMKLDAGYIAGIPDLIILYGKRWAALEVKKSKNAHKRPNQDYFVSKMNAMSFARFIFPENEEDVLNELQSALKPTRRTRVSRSKQVPLAKLFGRQAA